MSSRSRRLVELALREHPGGSSNKKYFYKKKSWDEYKDMELEQSEDPWVDFKKWKQDVKNSNSQETEMEQPQDTSTVTSTVFIESSVSWTPGQSENEESGSTSDQSSISQEISYQKQVLFKTSDIHKVNTHELEIRSNVLPVQEDESIISEINTNGKLNTEHPSNILKEIPSSEVFQYEEQFDTHDVSYLPGHPSLNVIYEAKHLASTSSETITESRQITILQNVILPAIKGNDSQNNGIREVPAKQNLNIQSVGIVGDSEKIVEVSHRINRIWDKKDRCVFCDRDCTNFSRHLYRNHENEDAVKKIMQLPKGDRKKKQMINLLRKEGNLTLLDENKIRPVQRVTRKYGGRREDNEKTQEFMPCPYCKGLYRLKSLRKHSKKCSFNSQNGEKCNIASLGQNLLVFKASRKSFLDKLRLKDEVFPKMHADRASFNGKGDPIICQYGEDYFRKHKRPHIKNAVSNKIRELGRLLIPLKDIYGISTMLEAMDTTHYDKVVHAAQIISGYDPTSKTFRSPSLAMHLKTILLGACLAAKTLLLKKDPVLPVIDYITALRKVKNFRILVDERWKFDMGSLALKDLNEKFGQKSQTLPITSDVIKFREYAVSIAEHSVNALKGNINDQLSFKKLTEAALVLTIVLNRKRVGDVQYIKLDSYTQSMNGLNQEECLNALSDSEKLLSAHFKRIITIGKGSKSIPILFPKNVQSYIDILLSSREKNQLIPKENPFLFALIGSKDKWLNGSSVLRKYAAGCGAENPKTLTSSRLRKQIATVLQLLHLNEIEKEQVATFMGHTKKTHEEFYRLPQDVYQTAKVAKLLLMMDKGKGAEYQGKTLEEIDVHLESLNQEHNENMESDFESDHEEISQIEDANFQDNCQSDEGPSNAGLKKGGQKKKERKHGRWNDKQKSLMKQFFKKHIRDKITPRKHECLQCQNVHKDMLEDKTWVQIKTFVYNTFRNQ